MSPLLRILLRVLRAGALGSAALVILFLAIEVWRRWTPGGFTPFSRQDIGFIIVMLLLLGGAALLARSISRELDRHSGS